MKLSFVGLLLVNLLFAISANAALDQYGGDITHPCSAGAASHFYTGKIGNRWVLCDPSGNAFILKGVISVVAGETAYTDGIWATKYAIGQGNTNPYVSTGNDYQQANEVWNAVTRLQSWGFNDLSDGSYSLMWPTSTDNRWNTGSAPTGNGGDNTIPPGLRMPFNIGAHLTIYALNNTQGCGASSPIKDMMVAAGAAFTAHNYNMPDWYDPSLTSCFTNILNTTNNPNGLYAALGTAAGSSTAHNDFFVYATLDEGDETGFLNAGPDFPPIGNDGSTISSSSFTGANPVWIALSSSPTITGGVPNNVGSVTYSIQENYTKVKFANLLATEYLCTAASTPLSCCTGSGTGTCSVDPNAGVGTAITGANMTTAKNALNTAWGASFSTLSTSDSTHCASNLATCLGSTGSPTYNAWGNTNCKASGQPLACCSGNGTGTCSAHGTGLLDEDGSDQFMGDACNLKTSSDPQSCLLGRTTSETTTMQADMSTLLTDYTTEYFGTVVPIMQTDAPGILLQMKVGSFGAPARAEVLQVACNYLTLPQIEGAPPYSNFTISDLQQRYDFVAGNCGDHPWMLWEGFFANPDSGENGAVRTDNISSTQAGRGSEYQQMEQTCLSLKGTSDNTHHCVGWYWWDYLDNHEANGTNWGLVSETDNPYDGHSATLSPSPNPDANGYIPQAEGVGSNPSTIPGNYGDFLTSVTNANNAVYTDAFGSTSGTGGSNGIQGIGAW